MVIICFCFAMSVQPSDVPFILRFRLAFVERSLCVFTVLLCHPFAKKWLLIDNHLIMHEEGTISATYEF
jgi:hypothetical protein